MKKRLILLSLGLASLTLQAQDAKVSKEREALRRAQTALRAAQEQRSILQTDKANAEAQAAAALKDASGVRVLVARSAARLKAREAELESLRLKLEASEAARLQAEERASEREQVLQQQLLAERQTGAERQQANQVLTRMLERSTQSLAEADARNHKLYGIGQELVQRLSGRSALETALLQDPVLGLTAVRLTDQAESVRAALEVLKARPNQGYAEQVAGFDMASRRDPACSN